MKRSRFTEEQIIGILKEHRAGLWPRICFQHPNYILAVELERAFSGSVSM